MACPWAIARHAARSSAPPPMHHPVDQPLYPGYEDDEQRRQPERGGFGTRPLVDDGSIQHGMQSALARLEFLGDESFDALSLANENFASLACTRSWAHLKNTMDLAEWIPLLSSVGCDQGNVQALVQLAQQGVAGRVEANRLLWTWCHPQASSRVPYQKKAQVFRASIRNARKSLGQPPLTHQDWQAWVPGHALGPYWEPKAEYIPSWANGSQWVGGAAPGVVTTAEHESLVKKAVADATAGMLTMAEAEESNKEAVRVAMQSLDVRGALNHWRPWYVLASKHENGRWSVGWWYDERGSGQWLWWDGTQSLAGRGPWTD